MLAAFRWNLPVLSYIALVVGAFLIYNTISISVVRRRSEIGILRALGATRHVVLTGFRLEAAFLAAAGSAVGLLLGRLMALGAVRLLGSTVQSLYVSSEPGPVEFTPGLRRGRARRTARHFAAGGTRSRLRGGTSDARRSHGPRPRRISRRCPLPVESPAGRTADTASGRTSQLPGVGSHPVFGYIAALLLIAAAAIAIPGLLNTFVG